MTLKIKGFNKFARQLKKMGVDATKVVESTLYEEAEKIIGEAKEKHVPVDLGALRSSGFVEDPKTKGRRTSVRLGFGGPAAKYALIVHEDMKAAHTVGSAKYLKIPYDKAQKGMSGRLARRLTSIIKG